MQFPKGYEFEAACIDTGAVSHNSSEWNEMMFNHLENCYEEAELFDLTINPIPLSSNKFLESLRDKL